MKHKLNSSIDKSLTWLINSLKYFNLQDSKSNFDTSLNTERKRLGELALVLIILVRNNDFLNDKRVNLIKYHLLEISNAPDFYNGLSRNINLFPFYVIIYNGLLSVGIQLKKLKLRLQNILDSNFIDCIERTAWNQIDFRFHLDYGEFNHQMISYESMYKSSSLFFLPNIIQIRNIDVYAITHIIFHLTNFGDKNIDGLLSEKKNKLEQYIGFLISKYAYIKDWDLLAELLICCHNIGYRSHPLFKDCWEELLNAQNIEGDYNGREFQNELNKKSDLTEYDKFKLNYHPTFVSLFACALEHEHLNN